jgi:hypothetical protein
MVAVVDFDLTATDGFKRDDWSPRYYPFPVYEGALGGKVGPHARRLNSLRCDSQVERAKTNPWTIESRRLRLNHDHQPHC